MIAENYHRFMEQVEQTALAASRPIKDIQVVVVTKGHALSSVQEVIEAGATTLGENYVEEALPKITALAGYAHLEWHMIGHVQSRKSNAIAGSFAWLESLDSLKLARRLHTSASERQLQLPVLLECNISGEQTKSGWPVWREDQWDALAGSAGEIARLGNLEIRGLMTMPPFSQDPESSRPYFQRLRSLQAYLIERLPEVSWLQLSMGMSADFTVAIEEGATIVRIGTAIMGPRPES